MTTARDLILERLKFHLQPTPFAPSMVRAAEAIVERFELNREPELADEVLKGAPESWDGEDSADSIVIDYVREIERRLTALGGSLERIGAVGASTVADRRAEAAAAFEAAYDDLDPAGVTVARDVALTVATQVRVTPEVVRAAFRESDAGRVCAEALVAALRELGFEVVS